MRTQTGTQAIDRAAQLLVEVMESERPLAVGELAAATGLPKSTTSRLLGALERHGLVRRDGPRGHLRPGPVLLRFAHGGGAEADVVDASAPALDALSEATGETVNLAVPTPVGVDQVAQRDSRHFLGSTNWVGRRVPYHCTAVGKVFVAFGAATLPPGRLERLAPRTIVDRRLLERDLARTRACGYATAIDELEPGLTAVAAPVRAGGEVVAALSVSGPTLRLGERADAVGALLVREAAKVSLRLGHQNTRGAA